MIRRGKHVSCFTIVPNAIFEDARLSAAAKGTLGYLLSRPPDWQVQHTQLRRMMDLGRDAFDRVMKELRTAGYVIRSAEQRRGQDNTFEGYDYDVFDAPRAEGDDPSTVDGSPAPESRSRKPGSDNKEDSTKKLDTNSLSLEKDEPDFEQFHSAWGSLASDNIGRTKRAWQRLTPKECEEAVAGIAPFKTELRKLGRTMLPAAWRYLEERRWTLLAPKASTTREDEPVSILPLTRDWWATLLSRVERGEPTGAFVSVSLNNFRKAIPVRRQDLPDEAALAQFKAYSWQSAVALEWRAWFGTKGVRLYADTATHMYLPSDTPPKLSSSEAAQAG